MIISSKKIIVSVGLIDLICRLLPHTPQEPLRRAQLRLLVVLRHLVGALRVCFYIDSFVADIPPIEEEQERERRGERRILPRLTFDSFDDNELREMTRFSASSLDKMKEFFAFPQVIYLHPSEERPRLDNERKQDCHRFFDEELILFSLYRFVHGVSITVMVNRFGGNLDKWVYGFR